MKTTENISLGGYAFTIEVDAYDELESYLNDIRTCFRGDASTEEIVADIEERIAELLREKCISGMVVDSNMVRDIKIRIGNPAEMNGDTAEPEFQEATPSEERAVKSNKKSGYGKRLYRNMDERVIAGVCSGFGEYFNIDKVVFRIIFIVLFFLGFIGADDGPFMGFSILAYICLWIAMPAARTGEQKREMKGKPLDLKSYKAKDFEFEKEVKEVVQSPAGQTAKRAGGVFLGIILLMIGLGGLLGGIFIPSLPSVIGNEFMEEFLGHGPLDPEDQLGADLVTSTTFWGLILVMLGIFCLWFIYNGIMLIFDLKTPSWRPGLVLFIAWIISLFAIAAWVIKTVADALPLIV